MTPALAPRRLEPKLVERVWGRTDLSPLYGLQHTKIGEVWFSPSADFPLLVKFLFTSERLSVQVHPDDAYARQHERSRGKCEMWHILAAEPGASIAIGFRERVSEHRLRQAVADGSIEHLLNWIPVAPGETYYTRAGVVHAIGAGITLCEIQQNSDVTYRLYDYGRLRELHVDKAIEVCDRDPYEAAQPLPVRCEFFITEQVTATCRLDANRDSLLIAVAGQAEIEGNRIAAGEVWYLPAGADPVQVRPDPGVRLLRARVPAA